ncbi:MAG: radical SAM protein [Syntrophales bacterium]|jgi:radical SAM superfamily enzyme YgiQ (UPF0313 family)
MMKVAIIASPYPFEEAPAPPLGISYVAAAFEAAGAEVRIFDYIVNRYTPQKLAAALDNFRPDAIGAGSVTLNFYDAAEIVCEAKRHNPNLITMMGGPHVSFDAHDTLQSYPEIDLIIIGEGEQTIKELVSCDMDKKYWPDIPGLAFHKNGSIHFTKPRTLIEDLDTLPLPARQMLPLSRYRALGFPISIITSRGCPHKCIFCQGRRMVGPGMRQRSANLVVDEIEHILSYGIDRINFADDLFVSQKGKVLEVCQEIRRRGLTFGWSAFARVNTVDRDILKSMREAGCDAVSFGLESGNIEMLKRIRKGITLDQVRNAVNLCKETGIIPHASFMVGLPGETHETMWETEKFAQSLGCLYGYHILAPFPGTTVREQVDQYDLEILTSDWSLYDANNAVTRTSALSPEEINQFVADFEKTFVEMWEEQIQGYRDGTGSPEINFQVEGQLRTSLVYRILSEDLIELHGSFPLSSLKKDILDTVPLLSERIENATDIKDGLVPKTIQNFIDKGYIKTRTDNGNILWYWTHNNKVDY